MIANIQVNSKSFGSSILYKDLAMQIQAGQKIGLVGRNGVGKSTLLNIVTGDDKDFDGQVYLRKGLSLIASRQEHHGHLDKTVLDYITDDIPEFRQLKHILDTYPDQMIEKPGLMQDYTDALDRFTQLGFFNIEEDIKRALETYQISQDKISSKISELSGGQKRLVELVKVQRADSDLIFIDEPTNHMDYVAKASFLDWMKSAKGAVIAITHDRDLLGQVDKIVEIRDAKAYAYKGNYDDYLAGNSLKISTGLNEYQVTKQRIKNLTADIVRFKRLKERARDPGTIAQFKRLQETAEKELDMHNAKDKPSFWIDKESVKQLKPKVSDAYNQHKTKNIHINAKTEESSTAKSLVQAHDLSLGYDKPLFADISFNLAEGERLEIKGRNGVGKTTLVQAIIRSAANEGLTSEIFAGHVDFDPGTRIGVYHQELDEHYMDMTLGQVIEATYLAKDIKINDEKIMSIMGSYLFNPQADFDKPVGLLSGGQKARLQLISMLADNPNVLILDEPTNHLDLPSIEELESALDKYTGAVIYISHDSYFAKHLAGKIIEL